MGVARLRGVAPVKPCHVCGRRGLKAFASTVCAERERCIDLGRTRLGINASWYRTREKFPWLADRKRKAA